jgi:2-hydroxy-6-oxonona-2,4-dienedioate hydrolase
MSAVVSPQVAVAALEAQARLVRTPFEGGEMEWRIWGRGDPLILIHGGHGSWMHWARNILPLAERFQVIVPDLPGYGGSDTPPAEVNADHLSAIVAAGLEQLLDDSKAVAFAGFSFGGVMAGHIAARMAPRVRRLILLGAGGLALPRPAPPRLVKWQTAESDAECRAAHRANLEAVMIADIGKVDDLAIHIQGENTRRARLRSRSISLTDALRRKLDDIRLPLAGIWGELDPMTGPYVETRRQLLTRLDPSCPFIVIKGAGHWVQYEAPDKVNAAIASWLA